MDHVHPLPFQVYIAFRLLPCLFGNEGHAMSRLQWQCVGDVLPNGHQSVLVGSKSHIMHGDHSLGATWQEGEQVVLCTSDVYNVVMLLSHGPSCRLYVAAEPTGFVVGLWQVECIHINILPHGLLDGAHHLADGKTHGWVAVDVENPHGCSNGKSVSAQVNALFFAPICPFVEAATKDDGTQNGIMTYDDSYAHGGGYDSSYNNPCDDETKDEVLIVKIDMRLFL